MASQEVAKGDEPTSGMPSVDKALRALLVLAEAGPAGLRLADLASQLGLNKSSLHVTLSALRFRDFVVQSESSGSYRLGPAVGRLSQRYLNSLDIRAMLRPAAVHLAEIVNEVIHISVLDGTEILYLEKIESNRPIQPGTRVGMRLPALTTAMGRAMIAHECPSFEIFARRFAKSLQPRTSRAPTTLEEEWLRIAEAREFGYGVDRGENVEGLTAVAVAVLDGVRPVAAVSAVTLTEDMPEEDIRRHADQIRAALTRMLVSPFKAAEPLTG